MPVWKKQPDTAPSGRCPGGLAGWTWLDIARIAAGIVMLVLGLLGLVLPILQGILFLLIAAFLLAPYSRHVRRGLAWGEQRFPGVAARARRCQHWFGRS